jgi:hypothetical protein
MFSGIGVINSDQPRVVKTTAFNRNGAGCKTILIFFAGNKGNGKNSDKKNGSLHGAFFRLTMAGRLSLHALGGKEKLTLSQGQVHFRHHTAGAATAIGLDGC